MLTQRAARGVLALALLASLLLSLVPQTAWAGKRSMIPPGKEQLIRELVDAGLEGAPVEEPVDIHIDRDRIRAEPAGVQDPRFVLFHPEVEPSGEIGAPLAPGVIVECGPKPAPRACAGAEIERWRPTAEAIAAARDELADEIWVVEETGVQGHGDDAGPPERNLPLVDRVGALLTALAGLGLAIRAGLRARRAGTGPSLIELGLLAALLLAFFALTLSFTPLLPLHEHNSFVARSDCAIDPRCVGDPAGAWSPTTLHVYGALLSWIPYRVAWLSGLSLAISGLLLILVWALARTLTLRLGRPKLAPVAGLIAVAVLALHPVFWRLSGSASFWPWTLAWMFGAALAGSHAADEGAREDGSPTLAAVAWIVAACALAFACAGNLVCLTLGPLFVLAPLCWIGGATGEARPRPRSSVRALVTAAVALGLFALLVGEDYLLGYMQAFGPEGLDETVTLRAMIDSFDPLLLDPRVSSAAWILPLLLGFAWLLRRPEGGGPGWRPLLILAPVGYAWLVPHAYLGMAAGEVLGLGYPVGFINHHWELVFSAVAVGLGLAWIVAFAERRWPGRAEGLLRWRRLLPAAFVILALALQGLAREGWRMATGARVVERELAALDQAFAELPPHDLLIVAPPTLDPLEGAERRGDLIEVVFPVGAYDYAMRERGLTPALVLSLDDLPEPRPNERVLLYVGSALRSFQPQEIEAGLVPEGFERPPLLRLRDRYELEAVHEFVIRGEQHEAINMRLAGDRVPELELGFYWLHPRPE